MDKDMTATNVRKLGVMEGDGAHLTPRQEQLQSLSLAARVFGEGVEKVVREVTHNLKQLKNVTPAASTEATQKAVQE
jgi:hypothetical protein